nr:MAG TPA: hypothetical protein [Caudoviricetes sp.]
MTDGNRPSCPAGGRASPTSRQKKLRLAPLGIYDNLTPRRVEVQRVSSADTQTVCGSLPKRFTRAKRGSAAAMGTPPAWADCVRIVWLRDCIAPVR